MPDETQRGLKDRTLQDYYEATTNMFADKGWTYFAEDMRQLEAAVDTLEGVKTQTDVDYRRGQLDILRYVITRPDTLRAAYDLLLEQDDELAV